MATCLQVLGAHLVNMHPLQGNHFQVVTSRFPRSNIRKLLYKIHFFKCISNKCTFPLNLVEYKALKIIFFDSFLLLPVKNIRQQLKNPISSFFNQESFDRKALLKNRVEKNNRFVKKKKFLIFPFKSIGSNPRNWNSHSKLKMSTDEYRKIYSRIEQF